MTAVWAFARDASPISSAADSRNEKNLEAEIVQRVVPLIAPGIRIGGVKINCPVTAGTTLKDVAPGLSQLTSRTFMVELANDHGVRSCGATLDAQRQVLVASRALAAGQSVSAQDFELRWVDAFTGAPGAAANFDFSGSLAATTFIAAGQPLYPTELAKPVAVHPGDSVTVVVRNGAITVRTELEARSSASIGDSATLLNPETGASVQVRVTGVRTGELVMQ